MVKIVSTAYLGAATLRDTLDLFGWHDDEEGMALARKQRAAQNLRARVAKCTAKKRLAKKLAKKGKH
jgi:hypothetical protein